VIGTSFSVYTQAKKRSVGIFTCNTLGNQQVDKHGQHHLRIKIDYNLYSIVVHHLLSHSFRITDIILFSHSFLIFLIFYITYLNSEQTYPSILLYTHTTMRSVSALRNLRSIRAAFEKPEYVPRFLNNPLSQNTRAMFTKRLGWTFVW
jgi:hypothetical protein